MKRVIIILTIVFALVFCANAQNGRNDGFFTTWDDVSNGVDKPGTELPGIPGGHGDSGDVPVPLGTGLFILTALGAGYALTKKHK